MTPDPEKPATPPLAKVAAGVLVLILGLPLLAILCGMLVYVAVEIWLGILEMLS